LQVLAAVIAIDPRARQVEPITAASPETG